MKPKRSKGSRRFAQLLRQTRFIASLIAGACACAHAAEPPEYLIDVWTREDGLPSSSVTAIAQTRDGYLWVGTYNGLARFDGVKFVTFDPENTPALQHARIRRLYVDGAGRLWINSYDGSLTLYHDRKFSLEFKGDGSMDSTVAMVTGHGSSPVFLLYTGELIKWLGQSNWQVLRPPGFGRRALAAEDSHGAIWYRAPDQKLWRIRDQHFELVTNTGLSGKQIKELVRGPGGQIWVGTDKELAVWDGTGFSIQTPTNGEPELNVSFMRPADRGMWVLANGRLRKAFDRAWVYEAEPCRGVFTGAVDRLGIVQDRRGGTWVYHYGKGLFHIREDGLCRKLELEEEFPGERVDSFFCDREGNLWAGVDRGGLVRVRERLFNILAPGTQPAARAVVSVAQAPDESIWIGTYGAGAYRYIHGRWERIPLPWAERGGFVFSVCPDRAGRVWLSAGEEDLLMLTNTRLAEMRTWPHGVKAILAASDGRVWIGTKNELICWSNGLYKSYRQEEGVRRVDFRALAEGPDGTIWAGTGDGALYKINRESVTELRPPDRINAPIWALHVDGHALWAGTFRGGLLLYRNEQFTRITKAHGLPDDVISQVLDDESGHLWLGSQQGIFRIPKLHLLEIAEGRRSWVQCTAYGRFDGLPSLECSSGYQPAACRTSQGSLLFATRNGLVCVDPSRLPHNYLPPPVSIESVRADGAELPVQTTRHSSSADRSGTTLSVTVPPGTRQIEFQYTGLSLVSPDRVQFRYRLVGLDRDWLAAGTRRFAVYNYLRPGQYRFEVIACNNEGVWNETPATMLVRVLPRFYETYWFIALVAVSIAGTIAATVRHISVKRMRKTLEHLERQRELERDRRRIAHDIHDELGAGLTHITLLSELARRSPPETVQEHLQQISQKARELTTAMDEIVWAVSPQNDTLESLFSYLSKFAHDYLRAAGLKCRIDAPVQAPPVAVGAELRHNVFLSVKEALTNVVKHAKASEVQIKLQVDPRRFTITICDNGSGITGGPSASTGRICSGHGLESMRRRLEQCGGLCTIESTPGTGTCVRFTVPIHDRAGACHTSTGSMDQTS